ncbi:hypothetical protein IEQ34_025988 [Dendrobium chrysotoxum]|uniref:Uncharacterized protein n=1 Tax=Dendrobium chrysotoxum TaxID=161865 RepID=A0AAV7FNR2_DENCH|nr:hypothetical protein IEQ34_025988 [Dendrobium chrysotoxum]
MLKLGGWPRLSWGRIQNAIHGSTHAALAPACFDGFSRSLGVFGLDNDPSAGHLRKPCYDFSFL